MMQKKASAENETLITIYLNIGPPGCPKKLNFGEVNHKLHPLGPGSSTRRLRVIDCKWPVWHFKSMPWRPCCQDPPGWGKNMERHVGWGKIQYGNKPTIKITIGGEFFWYFLFSPLAREMIQWLIIVEVNKKEWGLTKQMGEDDSLFWSWNFSQIWLCQLVISSPCRVLENLEKQSEYSVTSALEDITSAAQALTMTESHQASDLGGKHGENHNFFQLLAPVRSPPLKPKVQRRTMRIWRHMLRWWECAEANIPELSKPRLQMYWTKPIKKLSEFWVFHLYFSIFHIFNDPCNIISLS